MTFDPHLTSILLPLVQETCAEGALGVEKGGPGLLVGLCAFLPLYQLHLNL